MAKQTRNQARIVKHKRILNKLTSNLSTNQKLRIGVYKSLNHFYAYVFDPVSAKTLTSATTLKKEAKTKGGNIEAAKALAPVFAAKLKELKLDQNDFIFDRSGYLYHGRVKVFAETLRQQGIKF